MHLNNDFEVEQYNQKTIIFICITYIRDEPAVPAWPDHGAFWRLISQMCWRVRTSNILHSIEIDFRIIV